jgi:hypothetical protein
MTGYSSNAVASFFLAAGWFFFAARRAGSISPSSCQWFRQRRLMAAKFADPDGAVIRRLRFHLVDLSLHGRQRGSALLLKPRDICPERLYGTSVVLLVNSNVESFVRVTQFQVQLFPLQQFRLNPVHDSSP